MNCRLFDNLMSLRDTEKSEGGCIYLVGCIWLGGSQILQGSLRCSYTGIWHQAETIGNVPRKGKYDGSWGNSQHRSLNYVGGVDPSYYVPLLLLQRDGNCGLGSVTSGRSVHLIPVEILVLMIPLLTL